MRPWICFWRPDRKRGSRLLQQEVVASCGNLEPLLLPAYACMLRGLRACENRELLRNPSQLEGVQAVVETFEKTYAIKPSLHQLLKTMNTQGWSAEVQPHASSSVPEPLGPPVQVVQHVAIPSSWAGSSVSGAPPQHPEDVVARWYAVSWPAKRATEPGVGCELLGIVYLNARLV